MSLNILKIFLIATFSSILLTGCFERYEEYGFKSNETTFDWGVVGAKLIGSDKSGAFSVSRSSPYRLLIWFGSDDFLEGVINIKEIQLINSKTKKVVFEQVNIEERPIKKEESVYRAYFPINNIDLEYVEMELKINFSLKQDNKSTKHEAKITFEKDYKKFFRVRGV